MKNVLAFLAILMSFTIQAQDQIILKSGETIQAKVLELAPEQIKYKRFDHLTGPTIVILRKDVFLINYENGKSEVISALETAPTPQEQTVTPKEESVDDLYIKQPATASPPRTTTLVNRTSAPRPDYNEDEFLITAGLALPLSDVYETGFYFGIESDWYESRNFGFTSHFSFSINEYYDSREYNYGSALDLLSLGGIVGRTDPGTLSLYGKAMVGAAYTIYSSDIEDTLAFAMGAGVGFVVDQKVDVGVRFYSLLDGDFSQLQIGLGYRF